MKNVKVLVVTTGQYDHRLLDRMNIQTDCVVANQCNYNAIEEFEYKDNRVKWISTNTIGVGLNRNLALLFSDLKSEDCIVIFADDDMVFLDGYEKIVLDVFDKNPRADIVIFNLIENGHNRSQIQKYHYTKKIGYGAARIACRGNALARNGLFFHLCFGGGTEHSCGEDTIFLSECLRKNLRLFCVPVSIAVLTNERVSSWFNGYTDKFYFDKGFLLSYCRQSFIYLRAFKMAYMEFRKGRGNFFHIFRVIMSGISAQRKR